MSHPTPPPADAGPPDGSPAAGWLDIGAIRRGSHGCLAQGTVGMLVVAGLCTAWGLAIDDLSLRVFAGVVALPAVLLVVMLVGTLPTTLTRQGVAVTTEGLRLAQEPRLWFRGRELWLRWSDVTGIVAGGSETRFGAVEIFLYEEPPRNRVPTFARLVPAGRAGPGGALPSNHPHLHLSLPLGAAHDLVAPVRAIRPDLLTGTGTPGVAELADGAESADGDTTPEARTGVTHQRPGGPADVHDWISLRATRYQYWLPAAILTLLNAVPVLFGLVEVYVGGAPVDPGRLDENGMFERFFLVYVWSLPVATALAVLLVWVPWAWTRQGVEVATHGVTLVAHPMWWFRGRSTHLHWDDIQKVTRGRHRSALAPRAPLELHVYRVSEGARLPGWARYVPAGAHRWGTTEAYARVVLACTPDPREHIERAVRGVRPELVVR